MATVFRFDRAVLVEVRDGLVVMAPLVAALIPFGLLWGALAAGKGLSTPEVALMSATVFAGGAQFVALDLMRSPTPWLLLGAATLLINLRHVLMGASLAPRIAHWRRPVAWCAFLLLADEVWALAERRARERPLTAAYYLAGALALWAAWVVTTTAGTRLAGMVADPTRYGVDFAFVAVFVGLLAGFRGLPRFWGVVAASAIASSAVHPFAPGTGAILSGAAAGLSFAVVASLCERRRRRGRSGAAAAGGIGGEADHGPPMTLEEAR